MVDWFRVFIGTATAINTVANVSASKDIHSSVSMQQNAERIAMYRNMYKDLIFSTKRTADRLKPQINDRPFLVYVVSSLLKLRFTEMGLSSEVFPDYREKEYLADTEDLIYELNTKSSKLLNESQHDDAKRVISIILNDGDFENFLVELKRIKDLNEIQTEIKSLEEQRQSIIAHEKKGKEGSKKNIFWIVSAIGLFLTCGVPTLGYLSSMLFSSTNNQNLNAISNSLMCITPFIGIIFLGVGGYNVFSSSPEVKKFNQAISEKKNRYQFIYRQMVQKETMDAYKSKFGNISYETAMAVNYENDSFVSQKISEEEFERYFKISST